MEELTREECQASVQALLSILECPVCFMIPRNTNLAQCVNGHIICSVCRSMIKNECPVCRQKFIGLEPTVVKQMLAALPKFCKYPGCSRMLKPRDDHDFTCVYQIVTCKLCKSILSMGDSLSHVKRAHKMNISESHEVEVHFCTSKFKHYLPTFLSDQLFWTCYQYVNGNLHIWVESWLTSQQLYELPWSVTVELTSECGDLFLFTKKMLEKSDSKRILTFDFVVPESTLNAFSKNPDFKIRVVTKDNDNYLPSAQSGTNISI